jgi:hypothetical protein
LGRTAFFIVVIIVNVDGIFVIIINLVVIIKIMIVARVTHGRYLTYLLNGGGRTQPVSLLRNRCVGVAPDHPTHKTAKRRWFHYTTFYHFSAQIARLFSLENL